MRQPYYFYFFCCLVGSTTASAPRLGKPGNLTFLSQAKISDLGKSDSQNIHGVSSGKLHSYYLSVLLFVYNSHRELSVQVLTFVE